MDDPHKMSDKEIEIWVRPNPEAYARFKKAVRRKKLKRLWTISKKIWHIISNWILWFCAVGGFVLSLIQFFQDK